MTRSGITKERTAPAVAAPAEHLTTVPIWTLFVSVLLLYGLGALYPDSFLWGVHHLAFVPTAAGISLLTLALFLAVLNKYYVAPLASVLIPSNKLRGFHYILLLAVGVGCGILCYSYRISIDMYGDSRSLLLLLGGKQFTLADVLSLSDHEPLTRMIHQSLARYFVLDQRFTFQLVSAVCGGVFLVMYAWFVFRLEGPRPWKLFLLVIGLTAGVNQLLFGHVEDYTIMYVWSVLFLIIGWRVFEGKKGFGILAALFLVGTRLHIEMILFFPALLFAFLYRQRQNPAVQSWIQPKIVLRMVGVSLILCACAYFGYFRAYSYVTGDQAEKIQKTFLPLFSYLPEPHSYSLFSPKHISDIVQELLLVIAPGAIIILFLSLIWRRRVHWTHPRIIFYGLATFYFLVFDFTMDPFLSPPRDWDLLSLVAAPALFLAIALSEQWPHVALAESFWNVTAGCAIGLGVLSSTIFYVNAHGDMAGARLHSIGIWAYKSYYQGSAYMVNVAHTLASGGEKEILEREQTIHELEPYASKDDIELGFLVQRVAALLQLQSKYGPAAEYYRKSLQYDSTNAAPWRNLALCALLTKDFPEADRRITVYNENINEPNVVDFDGLRIAAYVQRCAHLIHTGADSSAVNNVLDEARKFIH